MQELKEAKFPRTGKEYSLDKTTTGFNLRLIDLDDELKPIFKTFSQLLELSQSGQIIFTGFEEKKNEAELILLNCMHEEKIAGYELRISELNSECENLKAETQTLKESQDALQVKYSQLESQLNEHKTENENLKAVIQDLKEPSLTPNS